MKFTVESRFSKPRYVVLTSDYLIDFTRLFEIGNFLYKIVEFKKFIMKLVCKKKKKAILVLTLNQNLAQILRASRVFLECKQSRLFFYRMD